MSHLLQEDGQAPPESEHEIPESASPITSTPPVPVTAFSCSAGTLCDALFNDLLNDVASLNVYDVLEVRPLQFLIRR